MFDRFASLRALSAALALLAFGLFALGDVLPRASAEDAPAGDKPAEEKDDHGHDHDGDGHDHADDTEDEPSAEAGGIAWEPDYKKALAKAKAEGKDLFINFTGSDWCGYCIKLEEEVFSKKAFADLANDHFVFVFLDSPRAEDLKAKVVDTELRDALEKKHGVKGYPTLILTTSDETPFAKASFQRTGPEGYWKYIKELRDNNKAGIEAFQKKGKTAGAEDIKAGIKTLQSAGLMGHSAFAWVMDRIGALDADGSLGLKPIRDAHLGREAFGAYLQELMPVFQAGIKPDWTKVYERLQETDPKWIDGDHQMAGPFINLTVSASAAMIEKGRYACARAGIARIRSMQMLKDNPRAKGLLDHLDGLEKQVAAAEAGAKEKAEEGEAKEGDGAKPDGGAANESEADKSEADKPEAPATGS